MYKLQKSTEIYDKAHRKKQIEQSKIEIYVEQRKLQLLSTAETP